VTAIDTTAEATVADAAIRWPDLIWPMYEVVKPQDFLDPYLANVFAAAVVADEDGIGHGYKAVHEVLVVHGHHGPRDAYKLFGLGGEGTGTTLDARHGLAAAALVAEQARTRQFGTTLALALERLENGAPVDDVADELGVAA
jgi:hypothetical protein